MFQSWKSLDSSFLTKIDPGLPLLTEEEEIKLGRNGPNKSQRDIDKLVCRNLRLVYKIAAQYASFDYPIDDAVQDGVVALIYAATNYNTTDRKGGSCRFAKYAGPVIAQSLIRDKSQKHRVVRVPYKTSSVVAALREYTAISGKDPTYATVADVRRVTGRKIPNVSREMLNIAKENLGHDRSLHAPVSDDSDLMGIDALEGRERPADEQLEALDVRSAIIDALTCLPERKRQVVIMRFLDEKMAASNYESSSDARFNPHTAALEDIGRKIGVSRERVRQIVSEAFEVIKANHPDLASYM